MDPMWECPDKLEPAGAIDDVLYDVRHCEVDGCDVIEDVHEHVGSSRASPQFVSHTDSGYASCPFCGRLVRLPHECPRGPAPLSEDAPITFEETFEGIFREAFDLLVKRQEKYGPENIRQLGLWGTFGRMADDKIERVRRAFNGTLKHGVLTVDLSDDFDDESLEDALLDIANYALIMLALKRGVWGRPLISEVF